MSDLKGFCKDSKGKITFKHVQRRRKGKVVMIALCCFLIVLLTAITTALLMVKHVTNVKLFLNEGNNFANSKNMIKIKEIVKDASPSMASIIAVTSEDGVVKERNVCSGIAVEDGTYMITSYNAISGANRIKVKAYDNSVYNAGIVGFDSTYDIAMIRLENGTITPVDINTKTKEAENGDVIVSVGNPDGALFNSSFYIGQVVNSGESVLFRSDEGKFAQNLKLIKTDISPKDINNCSALYDMDGNLLGINNMYIEHRNENKDTSYYISVEDLVPITSGMLDKQDSLITCLGIYGESAISQREDGVEGVYAKDVTLNGMGYQIGIRPTDIIVSIDDVKVHNVSEINDFINEVGQGTVINIKVYKNSEYVNYELKIDKGN